MPFFLIPTTLGVCFCLIWLFIGGMVFRDGQLAAQQEREFDATISPLPVLRISRQKSALRVPSKRMHRKRVSVAS
jgi:phospholipid N-methyltransferase